MLLVDCTIALSPSTTAPSPARSIQGFRGGGGGGGGGGVRSRLATGTPLHQPGPPEMGLGASLLLLRLHLGRYPKAPVEPPATAAIPVEHVAQKRKATSPLPPRQSTRPTGTSSPTHCTIARCRIKGRFKDFVTPLLDNIADRSRKPASTRWQILPEEMGKINIGLVEEGNRSVLVLINFNGELYQQVVINSSQPAEVAPRRRLQDAVLGSSFFTAPPSEYQVPT